MSQKNHCSMKLNSCQLMSQEPVFTTKSFQPLPSRPVNVFSKQPQPKSISRLTATPNRFYPSNFSARPNFIRNQPSHVSFAKKKMQELPINEVPIVREESTDLI